MQSWRDVGTRGAVLREAWQERIKDLPEKRRHELIHLLDGELPANWQDSVNELIREFIENPPDMATRQLSQKVLDRLAAAIPELIGGSADLTGSNNTRADSMTDINADDFSGRYINYGIREHGMAAIMNGMSLHGGLIPYGGTFLIFTDYCRPSIRLAAMMGNRVIFVMTHDSIGLGEDGPTHQPIEHLASLRAIPNLYVYRPADGVEVAECWMLAIESQDAPSVIALTRQKVPSLRDEFPRENMCAKGGYVLREATGERKVTLLATGSEVGIARDARRELENQGIPTAVVSMPCWRLFEEQPEAYRREVLGPNTLRIAIEAGASMGWERYIGESGVFIGMSSFGASAPAKDLYRHFDITPEHVVQTVKDKL